MRYLYNMEHNKDLELTEELISKLNTFGYNIDEDDTEISPLETKTTTLNDMELEDEMENFKSSVGGIVSFNEFIVSEGNISWSGKLDNENIMWFFSLDETEGCTIASDKAKLNPETLEVLTKLNTYYNVWKDYWSGEVSG